MNLELPRCDHFFFIYMRVHFYRSPEQFCGQEGVIAVLMREKISKSICVLMLM